MYETGGFIESTEWFDAKSCGNDTVKYMEYIANDLGERNGILFLVHFLPSLSDVQRSKPRRTTCLRSLADGFHSPHVILHRLLMTITVVSR